MQYSLTAQHRLDTDVAIQPTQGNDEAESMLLSVPLSFEQITKMVATNTKKDLTGVPETHVRL